jgi:hypothetical protein
MQSLVLVAFITHLLQGRSPECAWPVLGATGRARMSQKGRAPEQAESKSRKYQRLAT